MAFIPKEVEKINTLVFTNIGWYANKIPNQLNINNISNLGTLIALYKKRAPRRNIELRAVAPK
jgi:hypothetical protein